MSVIPTIAELRSEATALGLVGDAVTSFIYKEQELYRAERAAERDVHKADLAAAEAECLARVELERIACAEREKIREHEIRLQELNRPRTPDVVLSDATLRPKLPVYKDGDDITTYLIRFERIASLLQLDRNSYAVRLGSLLSGKAVKIYASLSPEITENYDSLKQALLLGFNKTHETYRTDFRTAKLGPNETYKQFAVQLGRMLDFWLDSRSVAKNYADLRNFFIVDQFMSSLPSQLRVYIKEQDVHDLDDVVRMADNWTMAHKIYPKDVKSKIDVHSASNKYNQPTNASSRYNMQPRNDTSNRSRSCFACGDPNHVRRNCPQNPQTYLKSREQTRTVQFCFDDRTPRKYMCCGTVNGTPVSTIWRDTGCSNIIISEKLFPDLDPTLCKKIKVSDYLGRCNEFPLSRCYIKCPFYEGWIEGIVAPIKFCAVLIGNVPGARDLNESKDSETVVVQAITRSATKPKPIHPLVVPQLNPINIDHKQFSKLQKSCPSLCKVRSLADEGKCITMKDGSQFKFVYSNDLLYRRCVTAKTERLVGKRALVVPADCRQAVLKTSHESPLAGHFGHRKTDMRLRQHFFWPSVTSDVRTFCQSCDVCQRLSPKGRVKSVPLEPMPIVTEPFSKVAIDLVGPLSPRSTAGNRYILTLIDFATGFPEAVPLKEIDSISVAEALLLIFSRVGIPREILSDRGSQFTSLLMAELHRLLGVKPLFTTPYHAMGNGRVERLHSTMKACLRKLCSDKPKDWDRYLVPTLFALREIPSDRSGFSAFELLYGRQVRGPLSVLKDLWEDGNLATEERTLFQYVMELQTKLQECAKIAAENADISVSKYKTYFDLKSQNRQFSVGNEVLILLPDSTNKLLMAWKGPFTVLERKNRVNYIIDENGSPKQYHANLLKRYYRRAVANFVNFPDELDAHKIPLCSDPLSVCQSNYIEQSSDDGTTNGDSANVVTLDTVSEETVSICATLETKQIENVKLLLSEYDDVMTPLPGCTETVQYDIELTTTAPVRSKFYPVPISLQKHFNKEVDDLLAMKIIQPSVSSYSSPIVMVRKPDSSYRMTVDYRALNNVTTFQAEPPCLVEGDLHKFSHAKHFSELDLSKAYYQITLTERSRKFTAFPTHRGLMEFLRLPFGLVNACSRYAHLMRIVLHGLESVTFYFDNIFIYTNSWDEHLHALRNVFSRLRQHGLTARPSKCRIGFDTAEYLGFIIGRGIVKPQESKLDTIAHIKLPTTKKMLRSFLGLVSFYRKFIENAASISSPLSDMLRKDVKEPLIWSENSLQSFEKLKTILSSDPVLRIPDVDEPFILRTDASGEGLGALMLQYHQGTPHPVAYASRKLLDREKNYSTIERECLAIVWGIGRFKYYLTGCSFLLEVDHKPLVYLNKFKGNNSRLLRWALSLQPYNFRIVHIAGSDNVGADLLSRLS